MSSIDIELGAELPYEERKLYEELKAKVEKAEATKQLLYDWADAHQDELLRRWMVLEAETTKLQSKGTSKEKAFHKLGNEFSLNYEYEDTNDATIRDKLTIEEKPRCLEHIKGKSRVKNPERKAFATKEPKKQEN